MHTVAVQREFIGSIIDRRDFGPETSHSTLPRRMSPVRRCLDPTGSWWISMPSPRPGACSPASGQTLNDLPEFRGLNPSIEHLARILFVPAIAVPGGPPARSHRDDLGKPRRWAAYTETM